MEVEKGNYVRFEDLPPKGIMNQQMRILDETKP